MNITARILLLLILSIGTSGSYVIGRPQEKLTDQNINDIREQMLRLQSQRRAIERADVARALSLMNIDLKTAAQAIELNRDQQEEISKIRRDFSERLKSEIGQMPGVDPPNFDRIIASQSFRKQDDKTQEKIKQLEKEFSAQLEEVLMFPQIQMLGNSHLREGLTTALLHSPIGDFIELDDEQRLQIKKKATRFAEEATRELLDLRAKSKEIFRSQLSSKQWQRLEEIYGKEQLTNYPDLWQFHPERLLGCYALDNPKEVGLTKGPKVIFSRVNLTPNRNVNIPTGEFEFTASFEVANLTTNATVGVVLGMLMERQENNGKWTEVKDGFWMPSTQLVVPRDSSTVALKRTMNLPAGYYRMKVGAIVRRHETREEEGDATISNIYCQPFSINRPVSDEKRHEISVSSNSEIPPFYQKLLKLRRQHNAYQLASLKFAN